MHANAVKFDLLVVMGDNNIFFFIINTNSDIFGVDIAASIAIHFMVSDFFFPINIKLKVADFIF